MSRLFLRARTMRLVPSIFIALATLITGAASAGPTPGMSVEECAVWKRELTFAQAVDTHDAKSFAEHLHAGAVFNAGTETPLRGNEAVIKGWTDIVAGKPLKLQWRPQFVNIGGDPATAISRGPFVLEDTAPSGKTRYRIGHYVSVWKKDPRSGVWHVLFDGGGPAPAVVDGAEAAQKHLAQASASCDSPK